ncbi:hypothetical protein LCGC14_0187750 [marine sediment metagenome]|uniref:Uncharacterized protein n=1 Tax=marine sediment metagenome TaxID=412755 RepID=A0A0F9XPZ8_9ZZZZ
MLQLTFALVMYCHGAAFVVDSGLTLDDCAAYAMASGYACELEAAAQRNATR